MYSIYALGPEESNSHRASKQVPQLLGLPEGSYQICFCADLSTITKYIGTENSFCVLPSKNSTTGLIQGYTPSSNNAFTALGTIILPIRHQLLVHPSVKSIRDIQHVFSHQQAFLQCKNRLEALGFTNSTVKYSQSTSDAALYVKKSERLNNAAIASIECAERYGLKVLIPNIHDQVDNATEFAVMGPSSFKPTLQTNIPPTTIGIIGCNGKYGKYFTRFFTERKCRVIGSDLSTSMTNEEVACQADVVLFCIPISAVPETIWPLMRFGNKDQLWMDITGLKKIAVNSYVDTCIPYASIHPMCAPTLGSLHGQTMVTMGHYKGTSWESWVNAFLAETGARLKESLADEHDYHMSLVQNLPHCMNYLIALTMQRLKADVAKTRSFTSAFHSLQWGLVGRLLGQNPALYADMQMYNPYTLQTLKAVQEELKWFIETIEAKQKDQFVARMENLRDYFGTETTRQATELTNYLIHLMTDLSEENLVKIQIEHNRSGLARDVSQVFAVRKINMRAIYTFRREARGGEFVIIIDRPRTAPEVQESLADLQAQIPGLKVV